MKKTLLVIDVQNYFLTNKATKAVPAKIAKLIESKKFDQIIFTKHFNHPKSVFVKLISWKDMMGGKDTEIVAELKKYANTGNTFKKDTYSIFKNKKFVNFLKKKKINELYLVGFTTENCILSAARDAFDSGYKIKVIKNCCATCYDNDLHQAALKIIKDNIGKVI